MKRSLVLNTALTVVCLCAVASPAYAHGSEAKNTEAIIESVTPDLTGASISIAAGDSFIVLDVQSGHTAEVHGYSDEPYLRVLADGTVEQNGNSPAVLLNRTRLADVGGATLDPTLAPDWSVIGGGGEVAWHDHRIHWMEKSTPPTLDEKGTVQNWSVTIYIDGQPIEVAGRLVLLEQPTWMWWLVALLAVALVFAFRKSRAMFALVGGLGLSILAIDAMRMLALPQLGRHTPMVGIAGAVTAIIAFVGLVNRRQRYTNALLAGAGTAACLAVYAGIDWMTKAVIPGVSSEWIARIATASTAGAGVVALYVGVNGALKISQQ